MPSRSRILMKFSGNVSFINIMILSKFQVDCILTNFGNFLNIGKSREMRHFHEILVHTSGFYKNHFSTFLNASLRSAKLDISQRVAYLGSTKLDISQHFQYLVTFLDTLHISGSEISKLNVSRHNSTHRKHTKNVQVAAGGGT